MATPLKRLVWKLVRIRMQWPEDVRCSAGHLAKEAGALTLALGLGGGRGLRLTLGRSGGGVGRGRAGGLLLHGRDGGARGHGRTGGAAVARHYGDGVRRTSYFVSLIGLSNWSRVGQVYVQGMQLRVDVSCFGRAWMRWSWDAELSRGYGVALSPCTPCISERTACIITPSSVLRTSQYPCSMLRTPYSVLPYCTPYVLRTVRTKFIENVQTKCSDEADLD